jgi:nitrite reductase (NADH) small subunit
LAAIHAIFRRNAQAAPRRPRTHGNIAVIRNADDEVFALRDECPHKGGPLLQGIVFGKHVACPLHHWSIGLADGKAAAPDEGCTHRFDVKVEDGRVYLRI